MNPENPLVSVIIPVYNGADVISNTLNAVLAQTYKPFEVIVIDDGSKDNTVEKLKAFGDRIVWKSTPNQGPAKARNEGLKLAKGEFISFLDHDDLWFKHKMEKQIQVFRDHPEVSFCVCNFVERSGADGTAKLRKRFSWLKYKNLPFDRVCEENPTFLLIRENFISTASNVIVRKSVTDKVGLLNPAYINAQEFDFWLRCSYHAKFFIISEVLLFKKRTGKNWGAASLRSFNCTRTIIDETIKKNYQYLKDNGILPQARMTLAEKTYRIANVHFEQKEYDKAWGYYWQGLKCTYAPKNIATFIGYVFKKGLRLLTGDMINKKKLNVALKKNA